MKTDKTSLLQSAETVRKTATGGGLGESVKAVGRYRWTICALLFFATTVNYLDRQVLSLLKPELEKFLQKLKQLEKSRTETRSFAYLDITSWVESKVYGKPMSEVINGKYRGSKRR